MRIAIVSTYYSRGMGYTENCLPKALAELGHDVHVFTSNFNVYGTTPDYAANYEAFLGPADQGIGRFAVDGYVVNRLPSRSIAGYLALQGLASAVRRMSPDIVHSTAVASLHTYELAILRLFGSYRLFAECHQHLSVVRPELRIHSAVPWRRALFWMTRTMPTFLASRAIEKCYAVAPDCLEVAAELYGVPREKLTVQSLGTDTVHFHPCQSPLDLDDRERRRAAFAYPRDAVVCIYTGRLTAAKNPLALARAVARAADAGAPLYALFVGEGPQAAEITACPHSTVIPFVKYEELAVLYRMADLGVWPRQESLSMLDAAASALPVVASARMGDASRVTGNGALYDENSEEDLSRVLLGFMDPEVRAKAGVVGRAKMLASYSWQAIARRYVSDYESALSLQ